jgi:hypothetical protein
MELVQNLKLKAGDPLFIISAPDGADRLLPGFDIKTKLGRAKPVSQLMLFVRDGIELADYLHKVEGHIGHNTLFWICYPKKTGNIASDLITMKPWEVVFNAGFTGQTSVSINDDWTGLRLTNAPKKKPTAADVPMAERKVEGIDYVNRTATLPADAQKILRKHEGLVDFFNAMSFTHKREYIEAIVDAKKPETRIRRIEKMAEMLQKMQSEKELKKLMKPKR